MPGKHSNSSSSEERREMSWLGEGIVLSQRVLVVALAMSLPILLGYGVDRWTGAKFPSGVLAGSLFGMLSGSWQLRELLRWLERRNQAGNPPKSPQSQIGRSDLKASEMKATDQIDD